MALAVAAYAFVVIGRVSDEFPSLHLALVSGGIAAALALVGTNAGGGRLLGLPESRTVLALLALSMLTIPFSFWPGGSFAFVTGTYATVVFVFCLIVYTVGSTRAVKTLIWGVLAAMLFLEIGLVIWGKGAGLYITATYDANDIALVLVSGFPLATIWFLKERGPSRYLAGLISALAVVTIVLTRSRAGFVGFCVVVGLLLVRMPPRQRFAATMLVLGCVVIIGAVGSQAYWDRMGTIWGGGDPDSVPADDYDASGLWGGRWGVWQTALRLALEHAVMGVGAGVYEVAEGLSHGGAGPWSAAHNAFLQIGAELGIAGLALFIFLLYRAVKNCRSVVRLARQEPRLAVDAWLARSVEISLYGYIVVGLSLSQAYSHMLYVLVAISVVLARLASERAEGVAGVP